MTPKQMKCKRCYDQGYATDECHCKKAATPKHTPTPWVVNGRWIEAKGTEGIAKVGEWETEQSKANAAFIVKAVNAHEELVGHLKVFKNYVGEMLASGKGNGNEAKMYPLIEQAIAKAEAL